LTAAPAGLESGVRTVRVSERDLLFALENRVPGTPHYLDAETGEVVPVFSYNRTQMLEQIRTQPGRFFRLAPQSGRQGYAAMESFVKTVSDPVLRERLTAAIKEQNVFREFRAVLDEKPAEMRRWQQFRSESLTHSLRDRLKEAGIELELIPDDGV